MGHSLIALIIKAVNEKEAEQKAWDILVNVICGGDENPNDFGVVVGSELDLEREHPDTYRWIPRDKTHPAYEQLTHIKIAPVVSDDGQKLINSSFPPTDDKSQDSMDQLTLAMMSSGYFCRDETFTEIIDQNDNRLRSKDYFVVPVDVHS